MSRTKFSSPAEVAVYLQETGVYKVSRRTVYNHIKAGLLKPDADGLYPFGDVRKYAEAHLQKMAEPAGETGDMNRDLIAAKTARERAQAQRSEFLLQKDRRKYLHVADHTLALAGRWQMLRDDLESLATSAAGDVVEMLGGDQTRIGEVQAYLQGEFRSFLAGFAKARDFEVRMTDEDVTDFLVAFKGQTDAAD